MSHFYEKYDIRREIDFPDDVIINMHERYDIKRYLLYYQLRYVDMSYLRGSKKDQNIFCFSCFALQIVTSRFANQKCFWEKQIHLRGYD